ncbi:MAG: hypothetical protein LBB85_12155 [Dysgonamonadaceae bacterium]|jgi:hypothetical protein|nr:hypothetical protein [Dysgonamonadaceae bacterium]
MKQKNFSKVLAKGDVHSPLWTTVGGYAANLLPKYSWIAFLIAIFLFPSNVAADPIGIGSDKAIVPVEAVYGFGINPTTAQKVFNVGDLFTVTVSEIVDPGTFINPVVPAANGSNSWPSARVLKPGDVYQATLTIKAADNHIFALTSPFSISLPAATGVTNWGAPGTATKTSVITQDDDLYVIRVVYQLPKTITQLSVDFNKPATGGPPATVGSVADSVDVGILLANVKSIQGAATDNQWKGTLTWDPAPTRFTAEKKAYKVTAEFNAEPGYTFQGVAAGALKWSTQVIAKTSTRSQGAANTNTPLTATFKEFSQFPPKTVNADKKPVPGESSGDIAISNAGWDYPATPGWSWSSGAGLDAAGLFLPDSVYKLSFAVIPKAVTGTTLPYGFFGLPATYYEAGTNIEGVSHKDKTVWRPITNYTTSLGISNKQDTITVTFPKTISNPESGNIYFVTPIAGAENFIHKGFDDLQTDIPGVKPTVYGWDEYDPAADVTTTYGGEYGSNEFYQFLANRDYTAYIKLEITDPTAYTFFYITEVLAKGGRTYTINGINTEQVGPQDPTSIIIKATFPRTASTIPGGTLAVPHPIAGLTVAERQDLLEETPLLRDYIDSYKVFWYQEDGTELGLGDVFAPSTNYTAKVQMSPKEGYTFWNTQAGAVKFRLPRNDKNPTLNDDHSHLYNPTNGANIAFPSIYEVDSDWFTVKFYKTARSITKSTVTTFVAPVAGVIPPVSFTDNDSYNATVKWTTEAGEELAAGEAFKPGTAYIAELTVNASTTNYWTVAGLAEDFFVPDAPAESYTAEFIESKISVDENYVKVKYVFNKTAELISEKALVFKEGIDFIYPTSGWSNAPASGNGISVPKKDDVVVENDQFTAIVDRWETLTPHTTPARITSFTANREYVLTLRIVPKDGYTVYDLAKEITDCDPTIGNLGWFTYPAGGDRVEQVLTWVNNIGLGYVEAQIYFKKPLKTITQIDGFTTALVGTPVTTATDIVAPNDEYTISAFELSGETYVNENGVNYFLSGEEYVYTFAVTPGEGYDSHGLAKDALKTTAVADKVEHNVNDLSNVTVYFHTTGKRVKAYIIDLAVPATGEKPDVDLVKTRTEDGLHALNITWSGIFDSEGRFVKGNTYSVTVVLDPVAGGVEYSFFGVPANVFTVKNYPTEFAIAKNHANLGVITIQFPTASDALILTAPKFTSVAAGYFIDPKAITIENNTARTYVIDNVVVSGTNFIISAKGTETISAKEKIVDWQLLPLPGMPKGDHTATITLYYHEEGKTEILYTTATVSLNVYGVGVALPEAAVLNAYGVNGVLTVKGLVAGEPFSVHNAQGVLVYRGIAKSSEAIVNAPVKGVYIVTSGGKTLKLINK